MKKRKLTYDRKNMANDVVLCTTMNRHICSCTTDFLMSHSVFVSRDEKPLSLLERLKNGYDTMFVISVNRNEYSAARRVLDDLEPCYRKRLTLNVI